MHKHTHTHPQLVEEAKEKKREFSAVGSMEKIQRSQKKHTHTVGLKEGS
jgi:hypothetical protein